MTQMKRCVAICLGATLALLVAQSGFAQSAFPTRVVKIIVPFPGGGINDVLARILADKLQLKWGQPVVIENKTGAGGNIGAEIAYQSEPDGHTLLLSPPGPLAINQSLYKQLSYKPQDFVPLTVVGAVPNVVIVRRELPVNSLRELIDYAKAHPGKVTLGSQGYSATPHLTGMLFQGMTGTSMVHVPYRGETLVLQDMIGAAVIRNLAAARHKFLRLRVLFQSRWQGPLFMQGISKRRSLGERHLGILGYFSTGIAFSSESSYHDCDHGSQPAALDKP